MATKKANSRITAMMLGGIVVGMGGMAYASVPLYRIFCQVTGYGGTTQRADNAHAAPIEIQDRVMTIRFDSSLSAKMPWKFNPNQREVSVRVGEQAIAFYQASNPAERAIKGTSTFNVTPQKAGRYFTKVECFCFTEQILLPGEVAQMPVTFYVDPAIMNDRNLDDVTTITLSYTFFEIEMDEEERAAHQTAALPATNTYQRNPIKY